MSAPYGAVVVDHAKNPRNRGALESPDVAREGTNPLCGDKVRVELRVRLGRIEAMAFEADACMVTVAAASMLSELVAGAAVEEARALSDERLLGALESELRPSRVGCALLPLQILREALG